MSFYFRIFGSVLVVLAAIVLGREYSKYAVKRCAQGDGFVLFLIHIKGEISRFLTTPDGFLRGFECEALAEVGFLSALAERADLDAAYRQSEGRLSLPAEARDCLSEFFSDFGMDYKDGEIKRCEVYAERLGRIIEEDKCALLKNVKLVRAILCAAALGIVILLI